MPIVLYGFASHFFFFSFFVGIMNDPEFLFEFSALSGFLESFAISDEALWVLCIGLYLALLAPSATICFIGPIQFTFCFRPTEFPEVGGFDFDLKFLPNGLY